VAGYGCGLKHSQFEYIELRDFAMIGGRFYERDADIEAA
jgi:hypothetical protein